MVQVQRMAFLGFVVGCGSPHHTAALFDALGTSAPLDAHVVPACADGAETVLDVNTPVSVSGIRNLVMHDDALYVARQFVVMLDPTTGEQIGGAGAEGPLEPTLWAAPDAVYASESSAQSSIYRYTSPTAPPTVIASARAFPTAVTSDGTYVYWNEDASVVRTLISGGPIETVMTSCPQAARLFVDGANLYCLPTSGHVVHGSADGSGGVVDMTPDWPTMSSTGANNWTGAIDHGHLYAPTWKTEGQLWDIPLPDGPATNLFTDHSDTAMDPMTGLAVDADAFYVATSGEAIKRIDRSTNVETHLITTRSTFADPVLWRGQLFFVDGDGGNLGTPHLVRRCVY